MNRRYALFATAAFLALAGGAQAQTSPDTLTVCGGSKGGTYDMVANELAKRLGGAFPGGVKVLNNETDPRTVGSMSNLELISSKRCDLGVTQGDVLSAFQGDRPDAVSDLVVLNGQLYKEYVHLLCPVETGWKRINDVGQAKKDGKPAKIIVGTPGSGTEVTWRMMRKADPKLYDDVERLADPPGRTALMTVRNPGSNTCMLWISGLNPPVMQSANSMSVNTQGGQPSLRLMRFDDRDIRNMAAPTGGKVYQQEDIARVSPDRKGQGGVYHNLMDSSTVASLTVNAALVSSKAFRDRLGPQKLERIAEALEDAGPTIRAQAGAK